MLQGGQDALPATKVNSEKKLKPKSFNSLSNSPEAKPLDAIPASASSLNRSTQLSRIRSIAEDIQQRSGKHNNVLKALHLTCNKDELRTAIPQRIVQRSSDTQLEQCRFAFHPNYANHLLSVMRTSSKVLNDFLQAAGSRQTFSYGTSKYYKGLTFEKILLLEQSML
jgi:hypothetical protein